MKLEEFQAKALFRQYGLPVPEGLVATRVEEAVSAAERLGLPVVVKAQVKAGGRGKAGGVKLVRTVEECREAASGILGMTIKGYPVERVLVDPAQSIGSEFYVGITTDRRKRRPVLMTSASGGVDIEEVARSTPERIFFHTIDPRYGLRSFEARGMAFRLFDSKEQVLACARIMVDLWRCFDGCDASLAEINPLALLTDGSLVALDAKIVLDDNALYRHPDFEELRLPTDEERKEQEAKRMGLSYVRLDGSVGCMVNGAGLAMATMDLIKHLGGTPANFLDIGGSSSPEKVVGAMKLLMRDSNVRSVFVNVFGGITRCDDVARGLVEALGSMGDPPPMVVRLTGTNEREGVRILSETGISATSDMTEGARRAIGLAEAGASGGAS
ncbi:ADP-forming succinate--CoA ligase subunit beta [Candidatus Fermentibacterales bacterium]|nr:ADP-forming succinate--CoA ligase subunit beta [Candidatus Fermentibacterales bacterium]